MARRRLVESSGTRVPLPRRGPTGFVFVDLALAQQFAREWREIGRRFPALSDAPEGMALAEHWANLATLRRGARDELRRAMREIAARPGCSGSYPIAV